jgi:hypothetical protein
VREGRAAVVDMIGSGCEATADGRHWLGATGTQHIARNGASQAAPETQRPDPTQGEVGPMTTVARRLLLLLIVLQARLELRDRSVDRLDRFDAVAAEVMRGLLQMILRALE